MAGFEFRKSSYSSGSGECVEVATNIPTTVAVRDSENPTGPCIRLSPDAWTAFLAHCRRPEHR